MTDEITIRDELTRRPLGDGAAGDRSDPASRLSSGATKIDERIDDHRAPNGSTDGSDGVESAAARHHGRSGLAS